MRASYNYHWYLNSPCLPSSSSKKRGREDTRKSHVMSYWTPKCLLVIERCWKEQKDEKRNKAESLYTRDDTFSWRSYFLSRPRKRRDLYLLYRLLYNQWGERGKESQFVSTYKHYLNGWNISGDSHSQISAHITHPCTQAISSFSVKSLPHPDSLFYFFIFLELLLLSSTQVLTSLSLTLFSQSWNLFELPHECTWVCKDVVLSNGYWQTFFFHLINRGIHGWGEMHPPPTTNWVKLS